MAVTLADEISDAFSRKKSFEIWPIVTEVHS